MHVCACQPRSRSLSSVSLYWYVDRISPESNIYNWRVWLNLPPIRSTLDKVQTIEEKMAALLAVTVTTLTLLLEIQGPDSCVNGFLFYAQIQQLSAFVRLLLLFVWCV